MSDEESTDADGPMDAASAGAPTCSYCQAPLYERHCKYVCPQHGVVIDCSDPFR
ncbi:HVO_2523 family zinc finger protein [Natronococcus jeotgali]|uniref:Small CPxCG-related zinc finger protein n=1 Tax=Natronococcus jeotgali DSM 18795 TaxID=1227498 RepID=L9XY62_9EURY|nr:HVO_2523 family zinc finger protein [Natronococcus jeotgali]ELY66371.1 hypothetical protein C492_00564 [Natronococcus jeotgali DSM 18795]